MVYAQTSNQPPTSSVGGDILGQVTGVSSYDAGGAATGTTNLGADQLLLMTLGLANPFTADSTQGFQPDPKQNMFLVSQGTVPTPARKQTANEILVLPTGLPPELRGHMLEPAYMQSHGYRSVVTAGVPGDQRTLIWVPKDSSIGNGPPPAANGGMLPNQTWWVSVPDPTKLGDIGGRSELVSAQTLGNQPPTRSTYSATSRDMLSALFTMSSDNIVQLQGKLLNAGLYPANSKPVWGSIDDATVKAYSAAMTNALQHPNLTFDDSLKAMASTSMADRSSARRSAIEEANAQLEGQKTASIDSTDKLNSLADQIGQQLLGRGLTAEEKTGLANLVQSQETNVANTKYSAAHASAVAQAQGVDDGTINAFVDNLILQGQHDPGVGQFGIRQSDWGGVLQMVGLDPNTPRNGDTERQAVKELALDYYAQFHNWQDVATALFAGPLRGYGDTGSTAANTGGAVDLGVFGYEDTAAHATKVARNFLNATGNTVGSTAGTATSTGGGVNTVQEVDPQAAMEQEIMREHPEQVVGHSWVKDYNSFLGMLGPGGGRL